MDHVVGGRTEVILLYVVSVFHVLWGMLILAFGKVDPASLLTLNRIFAERPRGVGVVLVLIGASALLELSGGFDHLFEAHPWLVHLPIAAQQALVIMCATDAGICSWRGVYADSTVSTQLHVFVDQTPYFGIAIAHTLTVAEGYGLIWQSRRT